MSAPENELQAAIRTRWLANPNVTAIVGTSIFDDVPNNHQGPFIRFGEWVVEDDSADCQLIGVHHFRIHIFCIEGGKTQAKELGHIIKRDIDEANIPLVDNALANIQVERCSYMNDPESRWSHGVIEVMAEVEET